MSSDTRRLTNPTLRICGRIEGSDTVDDDVTASSAGTSALAWLGSGLLGLLRCSRRRKEWRATAYNSEGPTATPAMMTTTTSQPTLVRRYSSELEFDWLTATDATYVFKLILVFPRGDQQCELIKKVAQRLGWDVTHARNPDEAIALFRLCCHDVAIIDRRGSARSRDADIICSFLKDNMKCSIVALTKKSYFTIPHKEIDAPIHLLDIGYTRALMECSHEGIMMNELIGIYASRHQPKSQLIAAQLLYLTVDRCRDILHVTNDQHIVQFANQASEKILGYKLKELVGRSLQEFVTYENLTLIDQELKKGRQFEGNVSWKRKLNEPLVISCRIIPMSVPSSNAMYYVYDYTSGLESTTQVPQRETVPKIAKPQRSARMNISNLPLESPITRIIALLTKASRDSDVPTEISSLINSAIHLLKSEDLYTPHLKDNDMLAATDPVTSNLLSALMSVPTSSAQRKSSVVSVGRQSAILKILKLNLHQIKESIPRSVMGPRELAELLDSCFEWSFDIFKLEAMTDNRALVHLGMALMSHFRVADRLECEESTLRNWLIIVEENYNKDVNYHTSTHAADVLQALARFMRSARLQEILDPLDEVAALIAAAVHDIGHPGRSSQFLCNTNHKLAILYNDLSVLESHHAALTFKLTLADDQVNIFKNLNIEVYKSMRQNVIDMVLATEMTKHFEHLAKFVNVCGSHRIYDAESHDFDTDVIDTAAFLLPENTLMTKRMIIKCADVSNPTRPFPIYVEWTRRIAEEYFNQTDEEKRLQMPLVMPMFDRSDCSIPKSQIGFVDYIINDMMEAWDTFIDMPELIGYMRENYEKWKELNEQGVVTVEDVTKIQESTPALKIFRRRDILNYQTSED